MKVETQELLISPGMKILSCDVLIYFKVKGDHKFDLDQIFGSARNQIEGFPDNTS